MAFKDINPCAPTHVLIIPKNKDGLDSLSNAKDKHAQILGHLMVKAALIAEKCNLK